jgi:hypothetical protein
MIASSSNAPAPASAVPGGSQVMNYVFMIGSEILLATWIWAGCNGMVAESRTSLAAVGPVGGKSWLTLPRFHSG